MIASFFECAPRCLQHQPGVALALKLLHGRRHTLLHTPIDCACGPLKRGFRLFVARGALVQLAPFRVSLALEQARGVPCEHIEVVQLGSRWLMRTVPLRRDHPNELAASRDDWRRLHGAYARLQQGFAILATRHQLRALYVGDDDACACLHADTAGGFAVYRHDLPEPCRTRVEATKCEKAQMLPAGAVRLDRLHA